MQRKPWDDSKIPPEKRHLLYENYHPLFIFRQRISKQADAILGMYLHSNLFTEDELKLYDVSEVRGDRPDGVEVVGGGVERFLGFLEGQSL